MSLYSHAHSPSITDAQASPEMSPFNRRYSIQSQKEMENIQEYKEEQYKEHLDIAFERRSNVIKFKIESQIGL
jgi:hypothetical protein